MIIFKLSFYALLIDEQNIRHWSAAARLLGLRV